MKNFSKAITSSLYACAIFSLLSSLILFVLFPISLILFYYSLLFKYSFIIALAFYLTKPVFRGKTGYSIKEALILSLITGFVPPIFFSLFNILSLIFWDTDTTISFFDFLSYIFSNFIELRWWVKNIWIFPIVFFLLRRNS